MRKNRFREAFAPACFFLVFGILEIAFLILRLVGRCSRRS